MKEWLSPPASQAGYDDLKKLRAQSFLWQKIILIIVGMVILGQMMFGFVHVRRYHPLSSGLSFGDFFDTKLFYRSPDGDKMIVLAFRGSRAYPDSTWMMRSDDHGETWMQTACPTINDLAINWHTGEMIGFTMISPPCMDSAAFASVQPRPRSKPDELILTDSVTLVWKSDDYGQTQQVIDTIRYWCSRIFMDWQSGTGRINVYRKKKLYTCDYGETWSEEKPEPASLFMDTIRFVRLTEGKDWSIVYKADSVYQYTLGVPFNSPRTIVFSDNGWSTAKFLYPMNDEAGYRWKNILRAMPQFVPWIGGAIMIGMYMLQLILEAKLRKTQAFSSNSLMMMSDDPSADDKLGFGTTSEAVVKLLKNPHSQPPIAIAFNGKWGSGKSSLMAQVQKKLMADKQFVTLWFNVWHFQSENHMLAAFLSSILQTFERSFGFVFRFRLFFNKLIRLPFFDKMMFYTGLFTVTPVIVYGIFNLMPFSAFIPTLTSFHGPSQAWEAMSLIAQSLTFAFSEESSGHPGAYTIPVISILAWIGGFFFLKKEWLSSGLSAFFRIIPINKFNLEAVREDPGFREKYKKEFWEILEAAGDDKRYVIFIDDMDRISGSRLLDILECVNFISDTASRPAVLVNAKASVFFVLGVSVEEVAQQLGKILRPSDDMINQKKCGADFLEKLIGIVVQVPGIEACDHEQLKSIVLQKEDASF